MDNILSYLEKTEATYGHRTAADDGTVCLTWKELGNLSRRLGTEFCSRTEPKKPIAILMDAGGHVRRRICGMLLCDDRSGTAVGQAGRDTAGS